MIRARCGRAKRRTRRTRPRSRCLPRMSDRSSANIQNIVCIGADATGPPPARPLGIGAGGGPGLRSARPGRRRAAVRHLRSGGPPMLATALLWLTEEHGEELVEE